MGKTMKWIKGEKHESGHWYQFILPRRLTLKPTRIYRWLNFYVRLKDKE